MFHPVIIGVGGFESNVGKTTLMCELLKAFPEWEAIKRESDAINARLRDLMRQGAAPGDPAVQAAVEDHRAHIARWYYPCSKEMHHGLGAMYIADPRFTENLDKVAPGFAQFLHDAIAAS